MCRLGRVTIQWCHLSLEGRRSNVFLAFYCSSVVLVSPIVGWDGILVCWGVFIIKRRKKTYVLSTRKIWSSQIRELTSVFRRCITWWIFIKALQECAVYLIQTKWCRITENVTNSLYIVWPKRLTHQHVTETLSCQL